MCNVSYEKLLDAHSKYGTGKDEILKYRGYDRILENVVIAPWWSHTIFESLNLKVEQINDKVYNFYGDDIRFSFIELKRIGAAAIMDHVLSLGVTECKNIIFLGSAGSLDSDIKIGDIVIPTYSICGDGASRYLNTNLEDEFGKKEIPFGELSNKIISKCNELNIEYATVPNYSVDSVFCQFNFIDDILALGAKTIEMETAMLFKASNVMKKNAAAIFVVSDNTIVNKSLYSGRVEEDDIRRHKVRNEVIPKIIYEVLK